MRAFMTSFTSFEASIFLFPLLGLVSNMVFAWESSYGKSICHKNTILRLWHLYSADTQHKNFPDLVDRFDNGRPGN
jgi:hypothetical protein